MTKICKNAKRKCASDIYKGTLICYNKEKTIGVLFMKIKKKIYTKFIRKNVFFPFITISSKLKFTK